MPVDRGFFMRDPLNCARMLVGCELLWRGCGGIIVETEAYSVRDDEACHTFSRPSSRHFVEIHPPGTAYVYLNYGVHWLLNFLVKGGAEGVHCGTIPELGLGFAVKCDDGAGRAADVVTAALIAKLLPDNGQVNPVVAELARPTLKNWNGIEVGGMRPAALLA